MEFWGVEVKAGQPLEVAPGFDKMIHLSQASLGETKKESGNDSVPLFVKVGDQKLVLGTLSAKNFPQISFDLVFEKGFELSHNWKNGSVYFCGYKADIPDDEDMSDYSSSEEEPDLPVNIAANGKPEPKVVKAKPVTEDNAAKPQLQVKPLEPKKDDNSDDDTDDSDESEDDSDAPVDAEDSDDDDLAISTDSDDESYDEDIMSEDEDTPKKKAESGKKRPTESATKTPVPAKKVKLATPQKTDGKKGSAHTATPHPSKQTAKTPANSEKSKATTPKSAGSVTCNSCSKTFNSDGALQSHTKAKHAGK